MTIINESFDEIEKCLIELGITSSANCYSEEDILTLEVTYEVKFPEIYKHFVLKYSTSAFENDVQYRPLQPSPWTDTEGLNSFGSFFGFEEGIDNMENKMKQYDERIPNSIIPIADDGACRKPNLYRSKG
jgi:hypothetical protein